jgi:hypothetical protein
MKTCKNCLNNFEITETDQNFYKKINVPEPTFCPDCRQQRRLAVRNERSLYSRKCDLCKKPVISIYSEDKPYIQYCSNCFFGDKWNAKDHGVSFDLNKPFFEQFEELREKIPRLNTGSLNNENCEYTNFAGDCKNCYLIFAAEKSEDCYYSKLCQNNKNCVDSDYIWDSELCYECLNVNNCYSCIGSNKLTNCSDSNFCYDLRGCKNCLFSYNLRNKEYYFYNKKISKQEFEQKLKDLNLNSLIGLSKSKETLKEIIKNKAIHRFAEIINCENTTGDNLKNSKIMTECFDMQNSENCAYSCEGDAKFTYDSHNIYYSTELCNEIISALKLYNSKFSMYSHYCNDIEYCDSCYYSKNLFGCVGMTRAEYCILNKQYSSEEYKMLRSKIIENMQKTQEYGEFFPISISPFSYNETIAQEFAPLTKEETLNKKYKWTDPNPKQYQPQTYKISENINDVSDSILNEILACTDCKKNFKIISRELKFYKKIWLPIPQKCPDCRYHERMKLKNPRKLWDRNCSKCGASIKTTYSPHRPEIVYCGECYLKEVY